MSNEPKVFGQRHRLTDCVLVAGRVLPANEVPARTLETVTGYRHLALGIGFGGRRGGNGSADSSVAVIAELVGFPLRVKCQTGFGKLDRLASRVGIARAVGFCVPTRELPARMVEAIR